MRILISSLVLLYSIELFATCVQKKTEIIIGCTYDCGSFYNYALKQNARRLGYSIKTINLLREPTDPLSVDGFLVPGGADIDPKFYFPFIPDELVNYTKEHLGLVNLSEEGRLRDSFEFNTISSYLSDTRYASTPLLGICRGMQMMAVASGLPLYVDLKHELGIPNRYNKIDKVKVADSDSMMSQFYPKGRTFGVKFHHQGIRVDYFKANEEKFPNLKITAFSHRQLIAESLEVQDRPALGVQYHPEKALTFENGRPIWKWFLTKACERSNHRD